ncbi:MAG TPA: permease [Rhodoferax sp.]|nr:permease [Rhodoferax sp.]HPW29969.1 permease [Rhodoferax sp.]
MQSLLSFDEGPPISAPLRFFLTAPLFAIAAGLLLLWSGPEMLASRWTPQVLAFTHLITVGFMLQVMLGALQQLLPVMAGACMHQADRVASVVHATISLGAGLLAAAFLTSLPLLFAAAAVILAIGIVTFVGAALHALQGAVVGCAVRHGLRLALLGLLLTAGIGLVNAIALGWPIDIALQLWTNVHLAWGFVGWAGVLLGVVGFVVVPMFQQTRPYPRWFSQGFAGSGAALVALWTAAELTGYACTAAVLAVGVVLLAASLALMTLNLLLGSKRPSLDAVHLLWRFGMASAVAACGWLLLAQVSASVAQWQCWSLLFGTLVLVGSFMSVIQAMLYKIVPFMVWLHLQERAQGRLMAPNVKKVLAEKPMRGHTWAHFLAVGLLLLAVVWPQWLVYPAGLALVMSNGWLLRNLWAAVAVYRSHLARIEALDAT